MRMLTLAAMVLALAAAGCSYDNYDGRDTSSPGRAGSGGGSGGGGWSPDGGGDWDPPGDGGNPEMCVENMDCPEGCLCVNGQCVEPGEQPGCTSDEQCEENHFCDMSIGECLPVPEPECSELGTEQECIDDASCQPVYGSNNCTPTDGGASCTTASATCVCQAPFFYAACIDAL